MSDFDESEWETVIGLEVHAELATRTKLFSSAPNEFGGEPNTNIDPVTLGLPGALPVLNEQAVELAIRVGLALHCTVQRSIFARKNYFYPDQAKNYQISQFDLPINIDGWIELPDGKRIGIERAHLEEDTGKSTHIGGGGRIHEADYSLVDYNRCGVPLLEIVGRPDLRNGDDAKAYVSELRAILVAVGASDGKMEEGSMRVDCNVSVRRRGETEFGTRCEVKNINSLRSLGRAINYEAARHVALIEAGEKVEQQTRHWDESEGRTHKLRSKEEADDYRYFPEPDLVELDPSAEWIERVRSELPSLPAQRRHDLVDRTGATPAQAGLIVERGLDALCIAAVDLGADGSRVVTHAEHNLADPRAVDLTPENLAKLTEMETGGDLSATQAKQVIAEMVETGASPVDIAKAHGFEAMDTDALATTVDEVIAANPDEWQRYCDGDGKLT
ncbi:MAG: Asp-tRNA(Asn)/Glu-tRNA(Gln) amidotransferase subunit GatB, partial [Microthrixaceae bacterium]